MEKEIKYKIAQRFFNEGFKAGRHFTADDAGLKFMNFMFDYAWANYMEGKERYGKDN